MAIDLRAINTVAGIGLNCVSLVVVLGVLLKTESERLVWIAFMRSQWVTLYIWLVLPICVVFATRDPDVRYLYLTSFAITALFTWLAEITYDRDIVTVLASEIGQSVLRFAAGKFFAPINIDLIREVDDAAGEVEDAGSDEEKDGGSSKASQQKASQGKTQKKQAGKASKVD